MAGRFEQLGEAYCPIPCLSRSTGVASVNKYGKITSFQLDQYRHQPQAIGPCTYHGAPDKKRSENKMAEVLKVETRDERGTQKARQMRRQGKIPAILYGHGEDAIALKVATDELNAALRHGAKTLNLEGAVSESAFIKHVHWDAFGNEVLHLDLTRIKKGEKVEVEIAVELRGVAPGTKSGGIVEQLQRSVALLCPATVIPDGLQLNINELELDQKPDSRRIGTARGCDPHNRGRYGHRKLSRA